MEEKTLRIQGLKTHFFTEAGVVKAVDGISFDLRKGESLGLVGESGSGKTMTALSVLRIIPKPGKTIDGKIEYNGENLLQKTEEEMRRIRGREIGIIFQDPSSSLNPVFNIETQLRDAILAHEKLSRKACEDRIARLLELVGISEVKTRMREYPHQFSGGMKQRVAIARALAGEPNLLFADEPTTNLDVTIQAQVLDLLNELKRKLGMSLVIITHDMGIIAKMTTRIVVLYAGLVAEIANTSNLFERPRHPYTKALLAAVPRLDMKKTLRIIPGNIPNLISPPAGCRFHPRCKYATKRCAKETPQLEEIEPRHVLACHEWRNVEPKSGKDDEH